MEAMEKLIAHLQARPAELSKLKEEGVRIVSYVPNGYMPVELVYACGAVPVGLARGGDHEPVLASDACLFRFLDTFCRSQIGYRALGKDQLYQLPDLLVVPMTDRNVEAIADSWQLYTEVEVFKLGVPKYTHAEHAFEYYVDGLRLLKQRLEELTGMEIETERLYDEIKLQNKIRHLLGEISCNRKSEYPRIGGKDFLRLNHATYYADRHTLVKQLESLSQELKEEKTPGRKGPRIMLTGSTMADGDYKVLDLLEETGANVVIEDFCEGVRQYRQKVEPNGNLIEALADRYLRRRVPPAFFHGVTQERFDFLLKLIREFRVDGVVWYSLMYRDSYDREGILFSQVLEQGAGIPFLKLNSDYDTAETESMRIRIETFVEIIKQGR